MVFAIIHLAPFVYLHNSQISNEFVYLRVHHVQETECNKITYI